MGEQPLTRHVGIKSGQEAKVLFYYSREPKCKKTKVPLFFFFCWRVPARVVVFLFQWRCFRFHLPCVGRPCQTKSFTHRPLDGCSRQHFARGWNTWNPTRLASCLSASVVGAQYLSRSIANQSAGSSCWFSCVCNSIETLFVRVCCCTEETLTVYNSQFVLTASGYCVRQSQATRQEQTDEK